MPEDDEVQNVYSRHATLGLRVPEEVFIVGCGGTGTWMSILMAMMGSKTIHVSDDDIIEIHNLSRLPFDPETVGKKKTDVLYDFIKRVRPECTVLTYDGMHNETDLFQLRGEVVFDCNDDHRVQNMIYTHCKKHKIKYVSVGCNADHITVMSDIDQLWGDGTGDRYVVTPMFIVPPMVAALCSVWNVVRGKKDIGVLRNIRDMFTSPIREGDMPSECRDCPIMDNCMPCKEHDTPEHTPCTHCPIQP